MIKPRQKKLTLSQDPGFSPTTLHNLAPLQRQAHLHDSLSETSERPNGFRTSRVQAVEVAPESCKQDSEVVSSSEVMLSPKDVMARGGSRLNRLSQYLPRLNTGSKTHKETPQPRIPSPPPTYRAYSSPTIDAPRPPSRAPPPTPSPHHAKTLSQDSSASRKLLKVAPAQNLSSDAISPTTLTPTAQRPRGNSLVPPPSQSNLYSGQRNRVVSSPVPARPNSYHSEGETASKSKTRNSWLPGVPRGGKTKSRNTSQDLSGQGTRAWINAGEHQIIYNSNLLVEGERIPELWAEGAEADTYVYLFPRESGRGPQFKVNSIALSASQPLTQLMYGELYSGRARGKSFDGRGSLTIEDATRNLAIRNSATPPYTPRTSENQSASDGSNESIRSFADAPREAHLYFPLGLTSVGPVMNPTDTQKLIDGRNFFAFLTGQPLVATPIRPTNFRILLSIAQFLKQFQFTNMDGSTYGEAVIASSCFFLDDLAYADVRYSLEKTVEALILGENMRSKELYNEAFAHAVGKYEEIKALKTPLLDEISSQTRLKLDRADIDLGHRLSAVRVRLTEFDFPSLFAGVGASTTSDESKIVRFKQWKSHFMAMRKQVLQYYKGLHGSWPPKANAKKNKFHINGLNRLVLKGLYADLCGLYDLLADRTSLTSRGMSESEDKETDDNNPVHAALRKLLAEYDRSSPPVQPPVPFDVPLVPSVTTIEPRFDLMGPKEQHKLLKRSLKDYEAALVLTKAHNMKGNSKTSFIEFYKDFELKQGKGMNINELAEMRYGHWIFLYAVIQALPLTVTDAPDLIYTDGVEYFLCEVPLGGLPWTEDGSGPKMSWYGIQGGTGVVSLPSDVVNYGVEATYRRSHCWTVAEKWLSGEDDEEEAEALQASELSPLSPPPGFNGGGELSLRPSARQRDRSSNDSPISGLTPSHHRSRSRQSLRNSISLGLERLPIPTGEEPHYVPASGYGSRPSSSHGAMSRQGSPTSYGGRGLPSRGGDVTPGSPAVKGSTFDDILGSMDDPKGKKKKK